MRLESCRCSRSPQAWLVVALLVLAGMGWAGAGSAEALPSLLPQCQDNVDNDGDGEFDFPDDPGCLDANDPTEFNAGALPACSDRDDNDGDGRIDFPDEPGCGSGADNNETGGNARACANRTDNDGDGAIDYSGDGIRPPDPGCAWANDNSELNPGECGDGIDNDGDGRTDWQGRDFGCASPDDRDELDPPQCNDGRDNDADGTLDHEADRDCSGPTDALEGPDPACSDGRDNDGDGRIDFPADLGCSSAGDDDETDTVVYALPGGPGAPSTTPGGSPSTQALSRTRLLSPFPIVRLRGRVDRTGTRITLLSVRAPTRSKVSVYCAGKGCPRKRVAISVVRGLVRVRQFEKRLRGGTILRIYVTRRGFVGKYTRFRIVNKKVPQRSDRCATVAGGLPRLCPSSS